MGEENNYGFSDEWVPSIKRPGYMVKTIQSGNATIRIHRPILTEEEAAKRDKEILDELERLNRIYGRRRKVAQNAN